MVTDMKDTISLQWKQKNYMCYKVKDAGRG